MSYNSKTRVSYVSGIGSSKYFTPDSGEEFPNVNPVTYSDIQFAKYVARKAVFKKILQLAKDPLFWLNNIPYEEQTPETIYMKYALSKVYTNEDAHHYALAPLNPAKYSKKGTLTVIGQLIFKTLLKDDILDNYYGVLATALNELQNNQNGTGSYYFLYLFLTPDKVSLLPTVAKKQKAQDKTLQLLTDGLGLLKEDLLVFMRRLTRRNLLKEPEQLINEMAGKHLLIVPGETISYNANTAPVRGNVSGIGVAVAIVAAIISLVGVIIAATAQIVNSSQARKLAEAQASIKPENYPDAADFPTTTDPVSNGNGSGNTGSAAGNIINTIKSDPLILIAIGAATYLLASK